MNKVPSMTGDVAVPRGHTSAIARCGHCGELVQLAQDLDNEQTRLAHRGPCEAWQRGGVAYVVRAAGVDPERAVELMVDQRRLLFTSSDANAMLVALDLYREQLLREMVDGQRVAAELPGFLPVRERALARTRELVAMLAAALAGTDHQR